MSSILRRLSGSRTIEDVTAIAPERRRNIRLTTVFQVAKIIVAGREELCILRDISPNGLKAEIYCRVALEETVTVEFRTGHAVSGRVVWTNEPFVGVTFAEEVSVVGILSHSSFDERVGRIRPPRLASDLPGRLRATDQDHDIRLLDISQAGAKIEIDLPFRPVVPCDMWLPALDRKRVLVRWTRGGTAGVMFADPIAFREFASWRRALAARDSGSRPTPA